jgi:hypothetical protein
VEESLMEEAKLSINDEFGGFEVFRPLWNTDLPKIRTPKKFNRLLRM